MGRLVENLSNECNNKSKEIKKLETDCELFETNLMLKEKEVLTLKMEMDRLKQSLSDQNVYSNNLTKHLNEKSKKEAILKREVSILTKQLEESNQKLQLKLIPNNSELEEIRQLREALISLQQESHLWQTKYKTLLLNFNNLESEKIMISKQFNDHMNKYNSHISTIENALKMQINSLNNQLQTIKNENESLKDENAKLLNEMATTQTHTFDSQSIIDNFKTQIQTKNDEIVSLKQQIVCTFYLIFFDLTLCAQKRKRFFLELFVF